jgi:hypothetical protein
MPDPDRTTSNWPTWVVATLALGGLFGLHNPSSKTNTPEIVAKSPGSSPLPESEGKNPDTAAEPHSAYRMIEAYLGSPEPPKRENELHADVRIDASSASGKINLDLKTNRVDDESRNRVAGKAESTRRNTDWKSRFAKLADTAKRLKRDLAHDDLQFIIATLPDPVDSHLQTTFDTAVVAIQFAAQRHGYLLDRVDFPWQQAVERGVPSSSEDRLIYRKHPGIMLLRRESGRSKSECQLLVIFVVGETPTAGIHIPAFYDALDQIAAWDETSSRPADQGATVAILGPTFSGASDSLRRAMLRWHSITRSRAFGNRPLTFKVISGSATADSNKKTLSYVESPAAGSPLCEITFSATVNSDSSTVHRLLQFLTEERRIPVSKIAFLVEFGTEYGRGLNENGIQNAKVEDRVLRVPYPMEIGRVRSEYESHPELAGANGQDQLHPHLHLSLKAPPDVTDVAPTFSENSAVIAERRLTTALAELNRRDVRAIGVFATDEKDVIFLARQVRRYVPDAELFTLESFLLYAHNDVLRDTRGMLIATTYPLFLNNQVWSAPADLPDKSNREQIQFSSMQSEGMFNAMMVHLNEMEHEPDQIISLTEYRSPFQRPSQNPSAAGGSVQTEMPPIWLTMVGQDGLWPIHVWPADKVDACPIGYTYRAPAKIASSNVKQAATGRSELGRLPNVLFSLATTWLGLIFGLAFVIRNKVCSRLTKSCLGHRFQRVWLPFAPMPGNLHSDATPCNDRPLSGWFGSAVFFCGLCLAHFAVSWPLWLAQLGGFGIGSLGVQTWLTWYPVVIASSAVGLLLLFCGIYSAYGQIIGKTSSVANVKEGACFLVVVGVLLVIFLFLIRSDDSSRASTAIFIERAGAFSSGVTPLTPLTLLGVALCCGAWGLLNRQRFLLMYPIFSPAPARNHHDGTAEDLLESGLEERVDALNQYLERDKFAPQRSSDWGLIFAVGFALVYILGLRSTITNEGLWLSLLLAITLTCVVIHACLLFSRAMAVSAIMERLLRRLGQHALVSVFDRIPTRLAVKAGGHVFSPAPHPGDLEISVRAWEQIVLSPAPALGGHIAACQARALYEARKQLADNLANSTTRRTEVLLACGSINEQLCDAARVYYEQVVPLWQTRRIAEKHEATSGSSRPTVSISKDRCEAVELFIGIRLVELMRNVFAHIRNLMTTVTLILLVLLWAVNSYPFQPSRLVRVACFVLILWMVANFFIVTLKFNRDEVLSRLAGTTPNRFSIDRPMVLAMITYVAIPLISLAATLFPELSDSLFSWTTIVQRTFQG